MLTGMLRKWTPSPPPGVGRCKVGQLLEQKMRVSYPNEHAATYHPTPYSWALIPKK